MEVYYILKTKHQNRCASYACIPTYNLRMSAVVIHYHHFVSANPSIPVVTLLTKMLIIWIQIDHSGRGDLLGIEEAFKSTTDSPSA